MEHLRNLKEQILAIMREIPIRVALSLSLLCLLVPSSFCQSPISKGIETKSHDKGSPDATVQARAREVFAKMPLSFELNQGQTNEEVRFISLGAGHTLWLTGNEAVLAQRAVRKSQKTKSAPTNSNSEELDVFRLKLANANQHAQIEGLEELPSKTNYFIGNDPKKWRTNVPSYAKVRYRNVYPGVDLVYYGNETGQLEYDFVVAPGADPQQIALDVQSGVGSPKSTRPESARLTANGDLILHGSVTGLRFQKPVIYQQDAKGQRHFIAGQYALQPAGRENGSQDSKISFEIATYDHSKPLIIDPAITYMSYVGGGSDRVTGVAVGRDSTTGKTYLYVAGNTNSPNVPVTPNAIQSAIGNPNNAFIAKLDPSASGAASLIYLSYFGGSASVGVGALAVDSNGNSYLTGSTSTEAFPQVQPLITGLGSVQSAFLTKFSADGSSILFSTRFGGTYGTSPQTSASALAVDATGNAYIGGATNTFIPLVNPYLSSGGPGFVAGFSTIGTPSLIYSTYLGQGPALPHAIDPGVRGLAIGPSGTLYVTGTGVAILVVNGFQNTGNGFFIVLAPNGFVGRDQLRYSTNFGGSSSYEAGSAVAVDGSGNAYITGLASSSGFVITPGAFSSGSPSTGGAFVLKVNPAAAGPSSLIYATFVNNVDNSGSGSGIAVDAAENAYVAGTTGSPFFLPVNPAQSSMFGVSQSTDGGKTWVALSNGLSTAIIWSLTVDTTTSPHNLYAATITNANGKPSPSFTPPTVALYKSGDGGLNWHPSNTGMEGLWTTGTAIDPSNNSTIYAATSSGVYRSADQGSTWALFNPGTTDLASQFVTTLAFDGSTLCAGTLGGLYIYNGVTWVRSSFPTEVDHIAIDLNSYPHTLYVSYSALYGYITVQGKLWKSADSGTTWTQLSSPSPTGITSFVLDPRTNPTTLYGLDGYSPSGILWKSTDGGANWLSGDIGLLNGGFPENEIAIDTSTTPATLYVCDFSNGVYRSTDGGAKWNLILAGGTVAIAIDSTTASPTTPSTIYAGTYGGFGGGFLAELNSTGSNLLFSTELSGIRGFSEINSLARGDNGTLYVGGMSYSSFLPTTNAFEPASPTTDPTNQVRTGFVAALGDAQLSLPAGCTTCSASTQVSVPSGTLTVSLPNVTGSTTGSAPTLTVTPLSASATANFSLSNNLGAYDISTTATYSASTSSPITLCFQAQTVNDLTTFNGLRLIHIVNGTPVDSTSSRDFATRTVCGSVTSLSPFILINGTPAVSWGIPQNIIYGTTLSSVQLNATASVPGSFTYSPASGTVLSPGQQTLSVTFIPSNPALYSSVTTTTKINVMYSTASCNGDLGHTILQPINPDGSSVFKLGSTVPTKFRVCDVNGVSVGLPGTVTSYTLIGAGTVSALTVDEDVYSTSSDSAFRWDSVGKQWIFNQGTGKNNPTLSQTNTIYRFSIALRDGSSIQFQYGLK